MTSSASTFGDAPGVGNEGRDRRYGRCGTLGSRRSCPSRRWRVPQPKRRQRRAVAKIAVHDVIVRVRLHLPQAARRAIAELHEPSQSGLLRRRAHHQQFDALPDRQPGNQVARIPFQQVGVRSALVNRETKKEIPQLLPMLQL